MGPSCGRKFTPPTLNCKQKHVFQAGQLCRHTYSYMPVDWQVARISETYRNAESC